MDVPIPAAVDDSAFKATCDAIYVWIVLPLLTKPACFLLKSKPLSLTHTLPSRSHFFLWYVASPYHAILIPTKKNRIKQ